MRDYGKIFTSIWNSRKFQGLQSDDARLAYLYLHTCQSVNSIGCFILKDGYAAEDLGWDIERYHRAIEALSIALLIGVHRAERLIRIVDFLTHDPFTNKNHAAGAIKLANSLPECDEKSILFSDIMGQKFIAGLLPENRAIEGLSKGYATPEPEPEPEPKKDSMQAVVSAGAKIEKNDDPDLPPDAYKLYEDVLKAAGWGNWAWMPAGWLPPGAVTHIASWRKFGITDIQIVEGVRRSRARFEESPKHPKAYLLVMQQIQAANIHAAAVVPKPDGGQLAIQDQRANHRQSASADRDRRILEAAARGTTGRDP